MYHIPAHKNVNHPAAQVSVIDWEAAFERTPVVGIFMGVPVLKLSDNPPVRSFVIVSDQVSVGREVQRYDSLRDDWPWRIEDGEDSIDAPYCIPIGGSWRGCTDNVYLSVMFRNDEYRSKA